tara:strand:+ start:1546 stop:1755 length:210 start_codon:yes stop_codon:yes gene_type:complete
MKKINKKIVLSSLEESEKIYKFTDNEIKVIYGMMGNGNTNWKWVKSLGVDIDHLIKKLTKNGTVTLDEN